MVTLLIFFGLPLFRIPSRTPNNPTECGIIPLNLSQLFPSQPLQLHRTLPFTPVSRHSNTGAVHAAYSKKNVPYIQFVFVFAKYYYDDSSCFELEK